MRVNEFRERYGGRQGKDKTARLTAEEMFKFVKADCPDIGPAAVYRTIQLSNELYLIDRVDLDDGFGRCEMGSALQSGRKRRHHHSICTKCGGVISFRDDLWRGWKRKLPELPDFVR